MAIQETKNMNKISFDELISKLMSLEEALNRRKETKRDRGLALKALEDDGSDFDEEEMAMITRKF